MMVFIDGGQPFDAVIADYTCCAPYILPGGFLAIHDIFPDPSQGGEVPCHIYNLTLDSGLFTEFPMVQTLWILRRKNKRDTS